VAWLAVLGVFSPLQASAYCYDEAGALYDLNPALLRAVAQVESSGRHVAMNTSHVERTKSYDIGLMQINSSWLPVLARYGITEYHLRTDACLNLKVGAWILASNMKNMDGWTAVGAYNASCKTLSAVECRQRRTEYTSKVYAAWQRANKVRPATEVNPVLVEASRQGFRAIRSVSFDADIPGDNETMQYAASLDDSAKQFLEE
jgi:soluble lytic murein transglycosylase-like protein